MDIEPFADVYTKYHRVILTAAHQRLGSFDDAQDVAATVFRIAWEQFNSGNEVNLPWLYQTLRNVIGNEYRRRNRADSLFSKLAPMYQEAGDAEPVDDGITVRAAMQELSAAEFELLRMAYWEDLSASEIAQILNTTATAIRLRLLRARRHLKGIISLSSLSDTELHHHAQGGAVKCQPSSRESKTLARTAGTGSNH
jgi:RNA polymerase sigma factor (sigma-70 family)